MPDRRVALLLLIVLAAGAAGFFALFERYEEVVERGASARARRNPFLAAELFLRRVHRDSVASHASWVDLGDPDTWAPDGALLVTDSRLLLSESQIDRVLGWVRGGGNLIVGAAPSTFDESEDRLLQRFGVEHRSVARAVRDGEVAEGEHRDPLGKDSGQDGQSRSVSEALREHNAKLEEELRAREEASAAAEGDEKAGATADRAEKRAGREAPPIPPEAITRLEFSAEVSPLEIHFSPSSVLRHAAFDAEDREEGAPESDDEAGSEAEAPSTPEQPSPSAWAGSDAGVHLVQFDVGDGLLTIVSDASIWGTREIAELDHAHLLRRLVGDDGGVVLLYGRDVMSAAEWLGRNARAPLLAGGLTLLAALWLRGRRFGPLRADPPPGSRSLADQLDGSARYLWSNGHVGVLVGAMRTGLATRAESRALSGDLPTGEQEFILLARRLQEIRNAR